MSAPYIKSLQELVASGDYGDKKYPLLKIKDKIEQSKDRYIFGAFSWKVVLETKAPALLFADACNAVAGVRGHPRIPEHPQHLLDDLGADSVFEAVEQHVEEARSAGRSPQSDQASVELPSYYSRLRFPQNEAYAWKSEYWVQIGDQTAKATRFNYGNKKNSIERMVATAGSGVLLQRPGDVVCLNNLVFHSVLLVYKKNTKPADKWGGIFGDVTVCADDRWESFRYATKVASGSKKASRGAWEPLISAYSVMETGDYDPTKYKEAEKNFMEKLEFLIKPEKAQIGSGAKHAKKRRKDDKMKAVRAAKHRAREESSQ